jgi:osmotically-inducible protein OsmY
MARGLIYCWIMTKKQRWSAVAIALVAGVVAASMLLVHPTTTSDRATMKPLRAGAGGDALMPEETIANAVRKANVPVTNLVVRNVGGIVILRGEGQAADGERAVEAVRSLGFTRVANLIQNPTFDDESIRRDAERRLASTRSLDGCLLRVSCLRGVIRVQGTMQSESQEDVARRVLKNVSGAQGVQIELAKTTGA